MRKLAILTALSTCCAFGAPAFGIISSPSAISYNDTSGNRRIYCFATGAAASHLVMNYWDGSNWNWADQGLAPGSSSFSTPMAVTYNSAGSQKIYVFGISSNGHLAVNYSDGTNWHWADQGLPPGAASVSSPTAVTYYNGSSQNIYVFATSNTGHLVVNYWDGSWHWADQGLPGFATISSPQALTYSVGGSQRIYAFARASNGHLVVNYWDGSWHWADQGLPAGATSLDFSSAISYYADGSQRIYVFGISNQNHLVVNYWDGVSWRWADQGSMAGALAFYGVNAVTYNVAGSQRIYVFTTVILSDGGLAGHNLLNYWDGSTWHWADQGLPAGAGAVYYPSAVAWVTAGSPRIYTFEFANTPDLYLNYWDGSAWRWTHQE